MAIQAPLDVFVVRKLGVPGHEELAMGAIASGEIRVLNRDIITDLQISDQTIEAVTAREHAELVRREKAYRCDRHPPIICQRAVILVDDGIATGATIRAAMAALRKQYPARLVVAVPVAPPETCAELREIADDVICLIQPRWLGSVGEWYDDFHEVSDDLVRELLDRAASRTIDGNGGR